MAKINAQEVMLQCGTFLLAIFVAEIVYRVSLFIEEIQQMLNQGQRRSLSCLKIIQKATISVISNKQNQNISITVLAILAVSFLYFRPVNISFMEVVGRMCPIIIAWTFLRIWWSFDNSLEDMDILEENHAELGPGLAANYWCSFLMPALMANIRQKMEDNL
eukprot:GFUD01015782.1.p1 GENE.GFUD01015782.1~~GFUD01015782.1.p1  ORF type:complete len:162 (+),score=18.45 GFUD01015782.1:54-539(+)